MERISFIDLGSNSVRFVIIEIQDNGSYQLIYQQKESIRLSEGLSTNNELTPAAMERALRTLKAFSQMAVVMNVKKTIAVGTAAVRLAKNGTDFIKKVKKETGFTLNCITGLEEARLGFLGVINTIGLTDFILFDLGGASIEISLVQDRKIKHSISLPMGALTVKEKFQKGNELNGDEFTDMMAYIEKNLYSVKWLKKVNLPLIGIGGTVRNLGKMDQRRKNYAISKIHNYELSPTHLEELFELVKNKKLAQRKKISGLSTERADIIVSGASIIKKLLEYTEATTIYVSGSGLREGLFYDFYGNNYSSPEKLSQNILKESTNNILLSMPKDDLIHYKYVAKLADNIYEQWQPLHNCGPRIREILESAALLHDIGKRINYYGHARHALYMIVHSNLYGLTHREQALCGFIAAFSHGVNNRLLKTSDYADLLEDDDYKILNQVSTPLALAEAIDESHEQLAVSVSTTIEEKKVIVTVWLREHKEMNVADVALDKIKLQFKKDFGKTLVVNWKDAL